jgi:Zn-dependent protease
VAFLCGFRGHPFPRLRRQQLKDQLNSELRNLVARARGAQQVGQFDQCINIAIHERVSDSTCPAYSLDVFLLAHQPFFSIAANVPALLLLLRSPFLFGYAKPVPVNFGALGHPRRDMVLVAVAGPATNLMLAIAAALSFHLLAYLPSGAVAWVAQNLKNALIINVVLAVFNMLPLPPLDGGRVAVGLLPNFLAVPLVRLEPHGMMILLALIFLLPVIGMQMGMNLNVMSYVITTPTEVIVRAILRLTGNV